MVFYAKIIELLPFVFLISGSVLVHAQRTPTTLTTETAVRPSTAVFATRQCRKTKVAVLGGGVAGITAAVCNRLSN
jgi:heterodisulfide reductase subunit A-like polyferredoxin